MPQKKHWLKKRQRKKSQRNLSFGSMDLSLSQPILHREVLNTNIYSHGRIVKVSPSVKISAAKYTCSISCPILRSPNFQFNAANLKKSWSNLPPQAMPHLYGLKLLSTHLERVTTVSIHANTFSCREANQESSFQFLMA